MKDATNPFNSEEFLAQYWQQSPLLIRNALPLADIISADDLASLALENEVESRIITKHPSFDEWHLKHGPFSEQDFAELPEENWTLLVQAVDHWIPEVRSLLKQFSFLPQWRIDDIMISFAAPGGGVGPHFDQYDVFLIQLEGQREWKTGQLCNENSDLVDQTPVKILTDFEEQESWVMAPGDVLYLPPALAHWGTSIDQSLTISVGFRAPADSEFISDFGHFLSSAVSDFARYSDPGISNRSDSPHEFMDTDIQRLQSILRTYADNTELLTTWFGQYMTEPKYDDAGVETGNWTFDAFKNHWQKHELICNPSSRIAFKNTQLFVDGQCLLTSLPAAVLHWVCDTELLTHDGLPSSQGKEVEQLMWSLLNAGAVFFED